MDKQHDTKKLAHRRQKNTKNIVIIAIIIGNLPLHGINELVNIANNLSLLLSIILLPTTAHALHPNPEHIVSACLP